MNKSIRADNPFIIISFFTLVHFLAMCSLLFSQTSIDFVFAALQHINGESYFLELDRFVKIKEYLVQHGTQSRWPLILSAYAVTLGLLCICIVTIFIALPSCLLRSFQSMDQWFKPFTFYEIICLPIALSFFIVFALLIFFGHLEGPRNLNAYYISESLIHEKNSSVIKLTLDFFLFLFCFGLVVMAPYRIGVEFVWRLKSKGGDVNADK